jgi:hypothetical protein
MIKGKLEGKIEMTERRGRRRMQLLVDLKEKKILEIERGSTRSHLLRTRFGRGYGPVVRQTTD